MAYTSFSITGAKQIDGVMKKIAGKIKDGRPAFEKMKPRLVKFAKDNMESEGVKLNKKRWDSLSPFTVAAKNKLGYGSKKILERTGKLKRGFTDLKMTSSELVIGNKVDYYPYHQLGTRKIPKREMLGVNDEVVKIVVDEIVKMIGL